MSDPFSRLREALSDRYVLDRELGQGGMATVYLARDLKHGRQVALKVLRPDLAAVLGAERFLQEIATTATLHHPHILPLFDSGRATWAEGPAQGEFLFYVMPFVEGESLRDRLEREKQLPVAESIRIATEVAAALDYAHRQGVLHRDIKPENILLHDGQALVADFGIALAMRNAGGARLTETGLSLGTPQYMSPEQATAERDLDARTDVYALGAVTYEMLTGEPPYTGPTAQSVIAKLMTEAPRPPSVLRRAVPPAVEAAVLTALEKLRADRWASASAFAAALAGSGDPSGRTAIIPGRARALPLARPRRVSIALGIATLALAALGVWGLSARPAGTAGAVPARVVIPLGQDVLLAEDGMPFDISADGSEIVYLGRSAGTAQLYLRPLGSFTARALPGTEGASHPFLSPDGRWIGFFAGGKLLKVSREGVGPIVLADAAPDAQGGTWGADGTILYAIRNTALYRVSEEGGPSVAMALRPVAAAGDSGVQPVTAIRWPSLLPDGRHALVSTADRVAVLTLATGELRPLMPGNKARYLPTGHLIFDQGEGRIRVVPFDLKRLAVTGEPLAAFEAFRGPASGAAQFAVSQNGTLVYVAGGFNRSLVQVDRNGRETPLAFPPRGYRFPALSPDGRRVALTIDPRPSSIWVAELARGQLVRVTTDSHVIKPVWSPDGERLAFTCCGSPQWTRWQSGEAPRPVLLGGGPRGTFPTFWAADGRILAEHIVDGRRAIVTLLPGDSAVHPLAGLPVDAIEGQLSPDGHWLVFASALTGSDEVYVRGYPAGAGNTLVSTGGGTDPHWSRDGKELYYRTGQHIMAVPVRTSPTFEIAGRPVELFSGAYDFSQESNWDVGPNGSFLMIRGDPASTGRFLVVLNWFTELRAAEGK